MVLDIQGFSARSKEVAGMSQEAQQFRAEKDRSSERLNELKRVHRNTALHLVPEDSFTEAYLIAERLMDIHLQGNGAENILENVFYVRTKGTEEFYNQVSEGILLTYESRRGNMHSRQSMLYVPSTDKSETQIYFDVQKQELGKNKQGLKIALPTFDINEDSHLLNSVTVYAKEQKDRAYRKLRTYKGNVKLDSYGEVDVVVADILDVPLTRDILNCYRAINAASQSSRLTEERFDQLSAELVNLGERLDRFQHPQKGPFPDSRNGYVESHDSYRHRIHKMMGLTKLFNAFENPYLPDNQNIGKEYKKVSYYSLSDVSEKDSNTEGAGSSIEEINERAEKRAGQKRPHSKDKG